MNNPFFDPNNLPDDDFNNNQTDDIPSPQTTKTLKKLFTILISLGLIIGIVTSAVIVKVMNKYGLTEKTNQFEQIQQ